MKISIAVFVACMSSATFAAPLSDEAHRVGDADQKVQSYKPCGPSGALCQNVIIKNADGTDGIFRPPPSPGTGGVTAVTVGTSSAQAVAAATRTARLAIQNVSASASLACSLGGTAALNAMGSLMIAPGQLVTFSSGSYVPADALNCVASSASTPATVWSK